MRRFEMLTEERHAARSEGKDSHALGELVESLCRVALLGALEKDVVTLFGDVLGSVGGDLLEFRPGPLLELHDIERNRHRQHGLEKGAGIHALEYIRHHLALQQ